MILRATAVTDTPDALLEKLVGALLEVFPQAQHVGVLVSEEKHGGLGQSDDMTIVAMAIDARNAKRKTTTFPGVVPPAGTEAPWRSEAGRMTDGDGPLCPGRRNLRARRPP